MYAQQNIRPDVARIAEQTILNLKELERRIEVLKEDLANLSTNLGHHEAARLARTPVSLVGPQLGVQGGQFGQPSQFGPMGQQGSGQPSSLGQQQQPFPGGGGQGPYGQPTSFGGGQQGWGQQGPGQHGPPSSPYLGQQGFGTSGTTWPGSQQQTGGRMGYGETGRESTSPPWTSGEERSRTWGREGRGSEVGGRQF